MASLQKPVVGFIGLGDLGEAMALRIHRSGFPLTVWARRSASVDSFRDLDVMIAADAAALARSADVLCLCVGYDGELLSLLIEDGLLAAMRPGSAVIVHSTVHPDTIRTIASAAQGRDISVVDAPITGGRSGALEGTLTIMVGCSAEELDQVRPLLSCLGRPMHLGSHGAGQIAKLINNTLMSGNMALAAAAIATAEELGLDSNMFTEVIANGSGSSTGLAILKQRLDQVRAGAVPGHPGILAKDVKHYIEIRPGNAPAERLGELGLMGVEALADMTPDGIVAV